MGNAIPAAMVNQARGRVKVTHTMTDILIERGQVFLEVQKANPFKVDKLDVRPGIEGEGDDDDGREYYSAAGHGGRSQNLTELEELKEISPHFHWNRVK